MENKKTKICHVAAVDISVKFLLLPQLEYLKSQGYEVYAISSPGKWKQDIEARGIIVKHIAISRKVFTPLRDLVSLVQLYWYFKKERFDVVHVHTPKPGLLGQLAAKMAGVPVIINTVHGLYFAPDTPKYWKLFFIFIEKIAATCSTLIFSQNKEDITTIIKEGIAPLHKVAYLGNGVDVKRFDPAQFSAEFITKKKEELGIPKDAKVVGIVGRLVKEKGYFDLFGAFTNVLKKYPNAVLLAVGPQEPEKKDAFLPEIAKNYGIEKNVVFLGERADLQELYPVMDAFVLPSYREGFPRTIIEAHVAGRPVIATNIRGCKEIIEHGKTGLLIPVKEPVALGQAIVSLLENLGKAKGLAENGRQKALREYDERLVFEKIRKAYGELLNKKILITGGAGFIGSHLADALIAKGKQVIIVDNFLNANHISANPKARLYNFSIDSPELLRLINKEKPDVVFHFAGPINLRRPKHDPLFKEGLKIEAATQKLADGCILAGVKKIVYLSSGGAIYQNTQQFPTPENDASLPSSAYGLANLGVEKILRESGMPFVALRLSNVYGPRQWESGVVPSFIKQIAANQPPIINSDGSQTRDFIYIDDVIDILQQAAYYHGSGIFNVGSGQETSLNDLLGMVNQLLQKQVAPEYRGSQEEPTPRSVLDISLVKKEFTWQPTTSLQEGLQKTITWYLARGEKKLTTCHVTTVDITARFIILNFLKFLVREGHDVQLVCSFDRHREFLEKTGIPLHHITMTRRITPLQDIVSFVQLFWYFRKHKFDIVHTYTPKAGILGRIAARLAGVPIVVHTSYGFYIGISIAPWLRTSILFAEKVAAWFCDLVISQNQEDIDLAVSHRIINPQKIKLLNYGIDLRRFRPDIPARQGMNFEGKKVIGMVGRFVKEKGYLVLFEAFNIVQAKHPDATLLLVAPKDNEKDDALDISILKEYGIGKNTVVLGYEQEIGDIETVYPLMDVFVLPSYREGFPFSVMEASASGVAVVASNIRGCREAVENGVTGVLFEAGNAKELAAALLELLGNQEKLMQMGRRGRIKAEKDFDENVVFKRIKEEYNRLTEFKK